MSYYFTEDVDAYSDGEKAFYGYDVLLYDPNHTSTDVPVFAYGLDAGVFDGITLENIQIPKTIAAMWGVELEGLR